MEIIRGGVTRDIGISHYDNVNGAFQETGRSTSLLFDGRPAIVPILIKP